MSFLSGGEWTSRPGGRADPQHVRRRPARRDDRLAEGTLACPRCDAPVALAGQRISVLAPLNCPFCGHRGPARTFLSLAVPTRPARVVLRISLGDGR